MLQVIFLRVLLGIVLGKILLVFADVDMSPLMSMIYSLIPVVFMVAILKFIPKILDRFGGRG